MEELMATSVHSSHRTFSYADDIAATWTDALLFAGRVLIGWSFLALGYSKLANIPAAVTYFASLGLFPATTLAVLAGCAELIFGAALILGVATRYAAFAAVVWTIASIAITHRYWAYPVSEVSEQFHGFVKNIAVLGGALYVFVIGAGHYSLDALLAKR
jgi:putative oxidoreductase